MNSAAIASMRLHNQQVAQTKFKKTKDLVHWMGAMQSQDYNMAKWAIGVRIPNATDTLVEKSIEKGEIIRTHVLRPTWHFVSAADIHWMLVLTSPQIKRLQKPRLKELELTDKIVTKSNDIIAKALTGGRHATREALISEFKKAKIATSENRASHLFLCAELDGIICSGATKNNKQTYALLEEWVPKKKEVLTREEAAVKLILRYFTSHGPATLEDFAWWSGLPLKDARNALEATKSELLSETINAITYWYTQLIAQKKNINPSIFLLPAFDEFIISYKNRDASLLSEHAKKTISNNGIFRPVVVLDGKVTGLWKRTVVKDKVRIETDFFRPHNTSEKNMIEKSAAAFGHFLGKEADVSYK